MPVVNPWFVAAKGIVGLLYISKRLGDQIIAFWINKPLQAIDL